MIVREIELQMSQRWPFYTLSFFSLAAGICAIVRTYEISIMGAGQVYTYEMLVAQILAMYGTSHMRLIYLQGRR